MRDRNARILAAHDILRRDSYNFDILWRLLPADGSVALRNVTLERGCFTIAGPKARELLQPLTDLDLSNGSFPWLSARTGTIGLADDVRLLRVNYEGELGWELYHPACYRRHLLEELLERGRALGLKLVGLHALESLRFDKSYKAMYRDMNTEHTALESGLGRFVRFDKGQFIGRKALLAQKQSGPARRLITMKVGPGEGSPVMHESIYHKGQLAGRVASAAYSHHFATDLALAFLRADLAVQGTELEVSVLGARRLATVIADSPYDPDSRRPRM